MKSLKLKLCVVALATLSTSLAWGHGGVPRVLSVTRSPQQLSVLDTLGFFSAPLSSGLSSPIELIERTAWSWLCDDAVDDMAGVDAAVRLDEQTIIAVARSGVYRSDDNGCTFLALDEPLSLHSITQLSAHPTRSQELVNCNRPGDFTEAN